MFSSVSRLFGLLTLYVTPFASLRYSYFLWDLIDSYCSHFSDARSGWRFSVGARVLFSERALLRCYMQGDTPDATLHSRD